MPIGLLVVIHRIRLIRLIREQKISSKTYANIGSLSGHCRSIVGTLSVRQFIQRQLRMLYFPRRQHPTATIVRLKHHLDQFVLDFLQLMQLAVQPAHAVRDVRVLLHRFQLVVHLALDARHAEFDDPVGACRGVLLGFLFRGHWLHECRTLAVAIRPVLQSAVDAAQGLLTLFVFNLCHGCYSLGCWLWLLAFAAFFSSRSAHL